jgi:hypothetical protein
MDQLKEQCLSSYFKLLTSAKRNLAPKVVVKHLSLAETLDVLP